MGATEIDLVAVQTYMTHDDYLTEESFRNRIRELFAKVKQARGDASRPAIVVFPAMIGGLLHLMGYRKQLDGARTPAEQMKRIASAKGWATLGGMARFRTTSLAKTVRLLQAPAVHKMYFDVFSTQAKQHGWYVVAGSLLLPRNADGDEQPSLNPADGQLYEVSYTFDPRGKCVSATRKVNLVPGLDDQLELSPGVKTGHTLVDTPAGLLGTAIGYDAFREPHTKLEPNFTCLVKLHDVAAASIVACPHNNPWPWDETLAINAEGAEASATTAAHWMERGPASSMRALRSIRYGICPMLLARFPDTNYSGRSHIFERKGASVEIIAKARQSDPGAGNEEIVIATVPARRGVAAR